MNSRVHFWMVCDAVAFIKDYGDEAQRRALQTLQNAYGENRPVEEIPAGRTAVEYLAGFESWHTDKYRDLAFEVPGFPLHSKQSITGFAGRIFTAFDHFMNPMPQEDPLWQGAEGYSYDLSSKRGLDSVVMAGVSDYLQARVDVKNSPVLERLKPFWKGDYDGWNMHLESEVRRVKFPSWTALTSSYYSSLILDHFEPIEVRGPNSHIVGLQILGPVIHSIADSCSIQHVRPSLGCGHPIWESYVQTRVYNREIKLKPNLIRSLLAEKPFTPCCEMSDGPMKGRLDVATLILEMSKKTVGVLTRSTERSWSDILHADKRFWKTYLLSAKMMGDVEYLYNQAVAGTLHAIVKCCEDLTAVGILESGIGLAESSKMPPIQLMQDSLAGLPVRKTDVDGVSAEDLRPDPFSHARDLLGFDPVTDTDLTRQVLDVKRLFAESGSESREDHRIQRLLTEIESSLTGQYEAMKDKHGPDFCPLTYLNVLPVESDLSAHFGTATFRLPSTEECNDPEQLEEYMDQTAMHEFMAEKLQITQAIASLKYYRDICESESEATSRLGVRTEQLRNLRDNDLRWDHYAWSVPKPDIEREIVQVPSPGDNRDESMAGPSTSMKRIGRGVFNLPMAGLFAVSGRLRTLFRDMSLAFPRVPVRALATVAAAVLVLVLIYPRGAPQPMIGLSQEEWKPASMHLMGPKRGIVKSPVPKGVEKPRVAIILRFQDFEESPDQKFVDTLYGRLNPSFRMRKRFDFIAPMDLEKAVGEGTLKVDTTEDLLEGLRRKFNVSQVIVVTVTAEEDQYQLNAELKDLATDVIRGSPTQKNLTRAELPDTLRKSVFGLLVAPAGGSTSK
jgi:hypothetical protein